MGEQTVLSVWKPEHFGRYRFHVKCCYYTKEVMWLYKWVYNLRSFPIPRKKLNTSKHSNYRIWFVIEINKEGVNLSSKNRYSFPYDLTIWIHSRFFGGVHVANLFRFLCCLLFVFVLCLVYPMLPVSLDFSFLIAPSAFANVYSSSYICFCFILKII